MFYNSLVTMHTVQQLENSDRTLESKIMDASALSRDVENVISLRNEILESVETFDSKRMLGVVSAAKGSDSLLRQSIPAILQQIERADRHADILLGLNYAVDAIDLDLFLANHTHASVVHLHTDERVSPEIPAKVLGGDQDAQNPFQLTTPTENAGHRIFIVEQSQNAFTQGKIRMLSDLFALCKDSIGKGWKPPSTMLSFDAESHFVQKDRHSEHEDADAIVTMLHELECEKNIQIIGAHNKLCVYRECPPLRLTPDYEQAVPAYHQFLNSVHGKQGFRWMPGGGTLGNTADMLAINTVASRYPSVRAEDVMGTVLAEHAGFDWSISNTISATNRCMSPDEDGSYEQQVFRWMQSVAAVREHYGSANVKSVMDCILIGQIAFDIDDSRARVCSLMEESGSERDTILEQASETMRKGLKHTRKHKDRISGAEATMAHW